MCYYSKSLNIRTLNAYRFHFVTKWSFCKLCYKNAIIVPNCLTYSKKSDTNSGLSQMEDNDRINCVITNSYAQYRGRSNSYILSYGTFEDFEKLVFVIE